tara:strand:- start:598 stop:738 length:141 start_codon:yes stop_codon:yes gene_type:complete
VKKEDVVLNAIKKYHNLGRMNIKLNRLKNIQRKKKEKKEKKEAILS